MHFQTTVLRAGRTATGLPIPDEIVEGLGAGKRPSVRITVGAYSYRTTVAAMGGRYLVPLSAEHRVAAAIAAGEVVEVEIELDEEPREVAVPRDFAVALAADEVASRLFETLSFTHRKEWVRWIEEAKKAETRVSRVEKAIAALREGRRSH